MKSELCLYDVEQASVRVILSTDMHIEAPNWTPDGAALIVNGRGRFGSREFCGFERVELSPGIPTPINRRFTVRFPVERGFTILSTNEIARLRVFCFASRRFPMDT